MGKKSRLRPNQLNQKNKKKKILISQKENKALPTRKT